jgi:hypothetical protein
LDIIATGVDQSSPQETPVETEIVSFVKALIKSRTRGPEPRVTVVFLGPNDVCVDADQLLRLQTKAGVK